MFSPLDPAVDLCDNLRRLKRSSSGITFQEDICQEKKLEIDKQKLIPFAIIGLASILALLPAIFQV